MNIEASPDLWNSLMFPEGIVERWLVANGGKVELGDDVVEIRIADRLHKLAAPAGGRLVHATFENDVIDPGFVLGRIEPWRSDQRSDGRQ